LRHTIFSLFLLAALAAPRAFGADHVAPDKFAEVMLKLLDSEQSRTARVGGNAFEIVVVYPFAGSHDSALAIVSALEKRRGSRAFTVRGIAAPANCKDLLEPHPGIGAIVAADLSRDCVRNLFPIARKARALTISTRKEDVQPLSMGIVSERGQVQVYRSDVALEKEGVVLSRDIKAVTRNVAPLDYYENYREAVRAMDFGDWEEAARRLQAAIDRNSVEGETVLIYGMRNEPYLPFFNLGKALFNLHDYNNALPAFNESLRQGAVKKTQQAKSAADYVQQCVARIDRTAPTQ
jgi:hypothetical protein